MSTDNNDMCANCGKGEEESISLIACTACKMVKYCSAACQKAHRSQHKKECKLRAAELHDEQLFKQPPPLEDCPICFLRVPALQTGIRYMSCCGKIICCGCIHAGATTGHDQMCPFCRAPAPTSANDTDEEVIKRTNKRAELGDAQGMNGLGSHYAKGRHGLPQDRKKALELWHRAGELGNAAAYCNIGYAHDNGRGVERDEKKAAYYYELAAMGGEVNARYNLGILEARSDNEERALKHLMIAAGSGNHESVKMIQEMYKHGYATREDYAQALKVYQAYLSEIKSDDRDKAAAYSAIFNIEQYKYYE